MPLTAEQVEAMAGQDFSAYAELNEDFADGVNDITRYLRKRNTGTRDEMAVDFTGTFTGIKTYEGKTAVPYKSVFTSEDGLMYQEGFREVYHAFKAEAIKKRDEYIASEKVGINHDLAEVPFLEYALNWVSVYRAACGAPQQKQYAGMMEFVAKQLKSKSMKDITVTELQAVVNQLTAYSSSYVSKFMTTLRGVFRTATAEGAVLRNPMELVKRPKCKKTEGHRAFEGWERDLITST